VLRIDSIRAYNRFLQNQTKIYKFYFYYFFQILEAAFLANLFPPLSRHALGPAPCCHAAQPYDGGVLAVLGRHIPQSRGDLGDHDGGANDVSRRFSPFGPRSKLAKMLSFKANQYPGSQDKIAKVWE